MFAIEHPILSLLEQMEFRRMQNLKNLGGTLQEEIDS